MNQLQAELRRKERAIGRKVQVLAMGLADLMEPGSHLYRIGVGLHAFDADGAVCLAAAYLEAAGDDFRYRYAVLCGGEAAKRALRTAVLDPSDCDEPGSGRRIALATYADYDDFVYRLPRFIADVTRSLEERRLERITRSQWARHQDDEHLKWELDNLVEVFKRCTRAWREGRAWEWRHRVRSGVIWSSERSAASNCQLSAGRGSRLRTAFHDAGMDFGFMRPGSGPTDQLVFLDDGAWPPAADARRIRDWVSRGGHLVVFADGADRDEWLRPDDTLGIVTPDGAVSQGYMDTFRKDVEILLPGGAVRLRLPEVAGIFANPPGEPIEAVSRRPDRVLSDDVLAVHPKPELLIALHRSAEIEIAALPHSPATLATLYERGQDRIVVILNRSHAPQTVAVDLAPGDAPVGSVRVRDLLSQPAQADACTTLLGGECMRSWDGGRAPS